MRNLPGWVQLVFGVGAIIIIALTASTVTLLATMRSSDKSEIAASIHHIQQNVEKMVVKQELMNKENNERNHTIRYLVMLMCVPFDKRQDMIKKYRDFYSNPKQDIFPKE